MVGSENVINVSDFDINYNIILSMLHRVSGILIAPLCSLSGAFYESHQLIPCPVNGGKLHSLWRW